MKPWQRDLLIRSAACDAMDCLDKMIATEKNKRRAKSPEKAEITLKAAFAVYITFYLSYNYTDKTEQKPNYPQKRRLHNVYF